MMRKLTTALSIALFLIMGIRTSLRAQIPDGPAITIWLEYDTKVISFDMVKVVAGSFIMGCTLEEDDCYKTELPSHLVFITHDYYIGRFEVTWDLWEAIMGAGKYPYWRQIPCSYEAYYDIKDLGRDPVHGESLANIQEFCTKLSRMTGYNFRLPTAAEWEYAARGGHRSQGFIYSGSNSIEEVAWYGDNSRYKLHSVGMLSSNELDIYDMSGNVKEACMDWETYSSEPQVNPRGNLRLHTLRGGSYLNSEHACRVYDNYNYMEARNGSSICDEYTGFRLVLEP